ncbi:DUF2188 domain-containing protein [uncultured Anaerococcus sp.]|uniref:DUF2188 domain-containing protein n=1 Tax=uncultured Anaerococcus sp. TaxID=293428 RepID=UPI0026063CC1|nr:DUF2188 domain-containing protein [uncultured Anaerococcus sp.]
MPFDRKDYPASMKNLDKEVRDKAIDIVNAMLEEGYKEDNAIPIAISQAKDWAADASTKELEQIRKKDLKDHDKNEGKSSARLQDRDVIVSYNYDKDKWQVVSKGASQVEGYYDSKKEASNRAKEIADNRESKIIKKTKEESK